MRSLAGAARRRPPVAPAGTDPGGSISVVVPARDEASRISPLLDAIVGAPGVAEVIVVDDESEDGTGVVARRTGVTVIDGRPLPAGWAGKAWALQQGLAAASGEWVVLLDADTRPSPALPAALVARAVADGLDLLTVAGRFECPTAPLRWLHPALLTTLVYRSAPPGALARRPGAPPDGQRPVHGGPPPHARRRRRLRCRRPSHRRGRRPRAGDGDRRTRRRVPRCVGPARPCGCTRRRARRGAAGRRSLSLPGVDAAAAAAGPAAGRRARPGAAAGAGRGAAGPTRLDVVLLAARARHAPRDGRASYRPRGAAYWLSPTADVVAVAALARGILTRRQVWRRRTYA